MSKKKNKNFGCGMICFMAPVLIFMGVGMAFLSDRPKKYIVTDKGANKIVYYSINNPADKHVMTFDGDTIFKNGGWYPYISIGDTIVGDAHFMNEPVNNSWYYASLRSPTPVTAIRYVNGRELSTTREIARRDSIIRDMQRKQR